MRLRHILSLSFLALVMTAMWLLWPGSGEPPWRGEIQDDELPAGLMARAGPLCAETFSTALAILDPDGVVAGKVETAADHVRVFLAETIVTIPWAGPMIIQASKDTEASRSLETNRLGGLRILLDPGHHGGAWSEAESRHFPVWAGPADETGELQVFVAAAEGVSPPTGMTRRLGVLREGDLNWATARLLQRKLEDAGAEVHLTRGPPPEEPFPSGMDSRFDAEHEARLWLDEARHRDLMLRAWARLWPARIATIALERRVRLRARDELRSLYNSWDLRRRSALAARIDADLTLSIHYNFARDPEINHVIVFMPGHKPAEELRSNSAKFHALARLIEADIPVTIEIGRLMGEAMKEHLDMPPAPPFAPPPGSRPLWWPVDAKARLFARNLAITRRTPGPVLLLEGPFMNHPPETTRLLQEDIEIDGSYYPERTRQYAEAVLQAVIAAEKSLRERRERREVFSGKLVETAMYEKAAGDEG